MTKRHNIFGESFSLFVAIYLTKVFPALFVSVGHKAQNIHSNSPHLLQHISFKVSLENLLLHQNVLPKFMSST